MKEQLTTPLYTALFEYSNSEITHFDVPGHKKRNNREFEDAFGEKILRLDANSTKDLDMLSNSTGVIMQAEQLYADAFYSDCAFMLVNGSTSGVQYMIMSVCKPNDKIILPRNVHKSAINAIIMSGAVPIFVQPEMDYEYGIANGVTFNSIKKCIKENPDAKAVFLINPTYFGVTSDLKSIIRYCHRHNMAVLVDQAHGAHLPFHPDLPDNAARLGADMVTCSMHKTGGSLTQSSILLLNEGIVSKNQVRTIINLLQTTSASYLLMASLDLARQKLASTGKELIGNLLSLTDKARKEITTIPGLSVMSRENINGAGFYDYDETRLVIRVNDLGLTGFDVYDILKDEYNIQVELAETYCILAIISIGDDDETINKLVSALHEISLKYANKKEPFKVKMADFFEKPRTVISPREAFFSPKKLVLIEDSVGEICGESIMIYPPGIPIIIPGERITEKVMEHLRFYEKHECIFAHDQDEHGFIKVLGE